MHGLGYLGWVLLSIMILIAGLRLDRADLSVPLASHGDALLILPLVKSMVETGTWWHNDHLGAPGIQELHDFPIVDSLHLGLLWLIGQCTPSYVEAFNLYYLSGYPLAVLSTMIVLRSFGVSFLSAGLAGLLFAFLPYHSIRGLGHYFLSAYWTLPFSLWPVLRLVQGQRLWQPRSTALGTLIIASLTACSGAYYAFFACAALAFAGFVIGMAKQRWRPLASALLVIGVIMLGGVINHWPTMAYQAKYGPNTEVTQRQPEEGERYGLKIAPMLLPVQNHRWKWLRDWRARYDSPHRDLQNENETATLGLIGSLTFLGLMLHLFRKPDAQLPTLLAQLVLLLVLLGTVGGLGSLFNFFITPAVRSLNRVSIVIAFFVFTAFALWLDRLLLLTRSRVGLTALLAILGIFDLASRDWFRVRYDSTPWYQDRDFFQSLPPGQVLCLPMIPYPETLRVGQLAGYDHVRGHLHNPGIHWSFGAMKGREADQWQRQIARLPMEQIVSQARAERFTALFIDLRGYEPPRRQPVEQWIRSQPQVKWHPDQQQAWIDITSMAASGTPTNTVRMLWLSGFVSFEPLGEEDRHRWCGRRGEAVLINTSHEPRVCTLSMVLRSSTTTAGELLINGGDVWSETLSLHAASPKLERTLIVPPGRHAIQFRYTPPREYVPQDRREKVFFIAAFSLQESMISR